MWKQYLNQVKQSTNDKLFEVIALCVETLIIINIMCGNNILTTKHKQFLFSTPPPENCKASDHKD